MVDNRKDKFLTSVFVWCCQNQVCNFLAFVLSFWLHGVWLGIRAFDCRSRGPRFKSGCPLFLWWTIEKTNFSLLFLFDVVKIKYAIYLILFWAFGCMGYGSVLEHLITDEEVPGSNLGAFLGLVKFWNNQSPSFKMKQLIYWCCQYEIYHLFSFTLDFQVNGGIAQW